MAHRKSPGIRGRKNAFGDQLAQLRKKAGLSQTDVVRMLQLAGWDAGNDTISRIESCERTLTDVETCVLLRVLGQDLTDLEIPELKLPRLKKGRT